MAGVFLLLTILIIISIFGYIISLVLSTEKTKKEWFNVNKKYTTEQLEKSYQKARWYFNEYIWGLFGTICIVLFWILFIANKIF